MTIAQVAGESFRWYVTLSALAWLMFPFLYYGLATLPDRGLSLVRPLGLLLAAIVPWWLGASGVLPYTTTSIIVIPAIIAALGWTFALRQGEIGRFLWAKRFQLLVYEGASALFFAGYVVFRSFNPAIQHTEKPMELSFLSSLVHAHTLPPADPWFLGHSINYYYLGYLLMSIPARVANIVPSHAFSLALATLFSSALVAAAGTAANLIQSTRSPSRGMSVLSGVLAGLFLVGIGNLVTPIAFVQHPLRTLHAGWWEGVGWNASRVIADSPSIQTINEFPAFSFVLGDLHPHVLALPMFIASIGIGLALARAKPAPTSLLPTSVLAGIVSASLYATNSWDMPPALLIASVGILIATIGLEWRRKLLPLGALYATTLLTALPFLVNYSAAIGLQGDEIPESIRRLPVVGTIVKTIGIVTWPKSSTVELFKVHGLFIAIAGIFLASLALPALRSSSVRPRTVGLVALGLLLASWVTRFPGLFWIIGPLALCFLLVLMTRLQPAKRFLVSLFIIAFLLLSITELVFLEDAFADRMNTVFKLYFQVWAIFAIACGVGLLLGVRWVAQQFGRLPASGISVLLAFVIIGSALYPPISAYRWTTGFSHFSGIDGLAYLRQYAPDEMAAIDWLNAHAAPTDHILEAPGCSYGESGVLPNNLFSMGTGLQTPLGWQFHEYQWRLGDPSISNQITQRRSDIATIYNSPTSGEAQTLLNRYAIQFIIDGPIEQNGYGAQCDGGAPYSAEGLAQLGQLGWPLAFQSGNVKIYQRP